MIEILSVKKNEGKKTLTLRAKENIDASRERRHSQKNATYRFHASENFEKGEDFYIEVGSENRMKKIVKIFEK